MKTVYDKIGIGYTKHRRAERRIVDTLVNLLSLSPPATLADIGAGTGNYSRSVADLGFRVLAIEPSAAMHHQASAHSLVEWHFGTAEHTPLPDNSVDGVFCILAAHHFSSLKTAVIEMARICSNGPIVWFTFDPRQAESPWLNDYFPTIWESTFADFPPLEEVCNIFETYTRRRISVTPWAVPHDIQDCFMAAGWKRPDMYLDPEVRACMSALALADPAVLEEGLSEIKKDIMAGVWKIKYDHLLERINIDWGYRFLSATSEKGAYF
jgi:ubiquinone/menaquinone biosynthesis C-methylase UbiE